MQCSNERLFTFFMSDFTIVLSNQFLIATHSGLSYKCSCNDSTIPLSPLVLGVGVQAVVTEYLIKYCELIFSDKLPAFNTPVLTEQPSTSPLIASKMRPKSLAISTPTKLLSLEEARNRALTACNNMENQKYIEVGGGPDNLPNKYHTVIELPGKKSGSFKHKKSTPWKSIFSGKEKKKSNLLERKISTPSELIHLSSSQVLNQRDYVIQ